MNGIIEWAHNATIEAEHFLARWQYFDSVYLIASSLTFAYRQLTRQLTHIVGESQIEA